MGPELSDVASQLNDAYPRSSHVACRGFRRSLRPHCNAGVSGLTDNVTVDMQPDGPPAGRHQFDIRRRRAPPAESAHLLKRSILRDTPLLTAGVRRPVQQ